MSKFIADFIGTANLVPCTVTRQEGSLFRVQSPYGILLAEDKDFPRDSGAYYLCIRPEDVRPVLDDEPVREDNVLEGVVENSIYMGNTLDLFARVQKEPLRASVWKDYRIEEGTRIRFAIPRSKIRILEG